MIGLDATPARRKPVVDAVREAATAAKNRHEWQDDASTWANAACLLTMCRRVGSIDETGPRAKL